MELTELLDSLGYTDSPNFISEEGEGFGSVVDYAHVFRRAAESPCNLRGVYCLRDDSLGCVPVVYVCETETEDLAVDIHRRVWNQNIVPFLLVSSPESLRLYPGFSYRRERRAGHGRHLDALRGFNDAQALSVFVADFKTEAIDSGALWAKRRGEVKPRQRVDRRLLSNLKKLDQRLRGTGGLDRYVSHGLIGKYVYLHYLRDRRILSDAKMASWGIPQEEVFGRNATREGLKAVAKELDRWLNGDVFPIDFDDRNAPGTEQIRRVAGAFAGDEPLGVRDWQLHLDFQAYDFSYIPIETLSVVYEQFLHAPDQKTGKSKGRSVGAYYTPIPVVNFMLSEMEDHLPLKRGVRVFDPACGSGAFLVQCYRRLIEKECPPSRRPRPTVGELKELLTQHIFGVDRDSDACSVAELSLILTLLDNVEPPDLETGSPGQRPPLPKLRDGNIFCDDFFHEDASWAERFQHEKFEWVVGNPPWKQLKSDKLDEQDQPVWAWMQANKKARAVGSNQTARAFAWRAAEFVARDGIVGMFLPAMTLFDDHAKPFRMEFLEAMELWSVANFSNLAEVLSGGRFRVPAAALFYAPCGEDTPEEAIRIYSPLVANQEPTRPETEGQRGETWSLIINASEIRDVPFADVANGSGLPWKLATWGSQLDRRLLNSLSRKFDTLASLERAGRLVLSQGLELRRPRDDTIADGADEGEKLEPISETKGKNKLHLKPLKRLRYFFAFPDEAVTEVEADLTHGREGRAELPLTVCRPPHIIVSAARTFAVYSDEFLIVPSRQIGIVSPAGDADLLKAIAVFLNSDFAFFHQFLTSTQFGVQRGRATLDALRQMPMPLVALRGSPLRAWVDLHDELVSVTRRAFAGGMGLLMPADGKEFISIAPKPLLEQINRLTYDVLGMKPEDRALVEDLVHVRLALNDGKVGRPAVRPPTKPDIRAYAETLKSELDVFVAGHSERRHRVEVVYDDLSAMTQVDLIEDRRAAVRIVVARADAPTSRELERTRKALRKKRSQWVYFDRNLRIYEGTRTFIFKPMQRFHWTVTQARIDARDIVAETLEGGAPS